MKITTHTKLDLVNNKYNIFLYTIILKHFTEALLIISCYNGLKIIIKPPWTIRIVY